MHFLFQHGIYIHRDSLLSVDKFNLFNLWFFNMQHIPQHNSSVIEFAFWY